MTQTTKQPSKAEPRDSSGSPICSSADHTCVLCGIDVDPDDFSNPLDADICGYCFVAKLSEIRRRRGDDFAPGLNQCGRDRELAVQADCEIRREAASNRGETTAVEIYDRLVRLLEA